MKKAIISDIHANLSALEAVLADIEKRDVDAIYCLGDVIGYGPDPRECLKHCQNLDLNLVDRVELVEYDEALECARRLAKEEGIICGISSGAAVAAAMRVAQEETARDKLMVVILPDSGERYLSTSLYSL